MPAKVVRFTTTVHEDDELVDTVVIEKDGSEFYLVWPSDVSGSSDGPYDSHAEALEFAIGRRRDHSGAYSGFNLGVDRRP